MSGFHLWKKQKQYAEKNYERYDRTFLGGRGYRSIGIIGITRVRNESMVIADTLRHVSKFTDGIIVLDDCSTDNTVEIVKKNKNVREILLHTKWEKERLQEETVHRQMLYTEAKKYHPQWIYYFDADERVEADKETILSIPETVDGIKVRLFDAYMTQGDDRSYENNDKLWNFRSYFGPEYRDILMFFRSRDTICFQGLDARETSGCKNTIEKFYCQHYGKAMSYEQWEETCDYYAQNFPEPYRSKWQSRKGKALHVKSDFQRELKLWDEVKKHGVKI